MLENKRLINFDIHLLSSCEWYETEEDWDQNIANIANVLTGCPLESHLNCTKNINWYWKQITSWKSQRG